jgi:hypothetical protein
VAGRVTVGTAASTIGGPPKRLTLPDAPKALPVTDVTSADEGPATTAKRPAARAMSTATRVI